MSDTPLEKAFNYHLERRLAAGGMGEVFLAKDKATGNVCVIKRMLPNLMSDNQFVSMFLDEAKLAAQLNHPNIAPLYDFGMAGGVLYLSMEYVPGANLRMVVKDHAVRKVSVPFDAAARIMSQAALALDYAHGAKTADGKPLRLVHRDVSPQNILLSTTGVVKLIDFGVAKAATASQQTAAGLIKGKYAYMSPEQLRGQTLDGRSDIFGLGLVLYELLAGERAIPGRTDAEVAQNALNMRFAPLRMKRPDLPERLEQILNKALQRDVTQRYQRAAELSSDLERFLADRRSSPSGEELSRLIPAAAMNPPPAPPSHASNAPWSNQVPASSLGRPSDSLWPPTATTPAFWENQPHVMTDVSTEEGLPPTVQLTPSQLPMMARPRSNDASEAPTMHIGNVKLPPPPSSMPQQPGKIAFPSPRSSSPMAPRPSPGEAPTQHVEVRLPPPPPPVPEPVSSSAPIVVGRELPPPPVAMTPLPPPVPAEGVSESAIQRAIRRGMMPWIVSAIVLVLGTAALVWGFVVLSKKEVVATPAPAPVAKVAEPDPAPAPVAVVAPVEAPDAAVAVAAPDPAKVAIVDSALVARIVASLPAAVSIDGQPSGKALLRGVASAAGSHGRSCFQDVATGLQHKRVLTLAAGDHRKEAWNPEHGKVMVRASPWAEIFHRRSFVRRHPDGYGAPRRRRRGGISSGS